MKPVAEPTPLWKPDAARHAGPETAPPPPVTRPDAGLAARLARGVTWNLASAVCTQGGSFAANVLLANLLGRELFGGFSMAQSTVLTLSNIAQLGLGITATKYLAEYRSTDPEKAGRILGLCRLVCLSAGLVAAAGLLLGAPWLAGDVLKAADLALPLRLAAAAVFFTVASGYQVGALAGLEGYGSLARATALGALLQPALCGGGALLWGIDGALAGLSLSCLARYAILAVALRSVSQASGIFPSRHGIGRERPVVFGFAIPAALSGVSWVLGLWLANACLMRQPDGRSEMGLYSAANNLRLLTLALPLIINSVGTSLLNNQRGLAAHGRYRRLFWANLGLVGGTTACAAVAVFVLGPWLFRLFGKEFVGGQCLLAVLMLAALPEGLSYAIYQVIQNEGKMWLSLGCWALPRDVLLVTLAYLLTPAAGALGLAEAYVLAWSFTLLTSVLLALVVRARGRRAGEVVGGNGT